MSPTDLMVSEARLALAAFGTGNLPRYEMHRGNARRIADQLALQEAQDQQRRTVYLAPGVIEGPNDDGDFLKQDNALFACIRWFAEGFGLWLLICAIAGFVARRLGWL